MKPKVSVIIPVYNSSRFVAKCCCSLFEQTLDSLQFIFVDDGSDDGSIDIIRESLSHYPQRIPQTSFITIENNRGVGVARHAGLKEATGEYIIHCDSDDWVELDAYQCLYEKAKSEEADIVTCAYSIDSEDGASINVVPDLPKESKDLTFELGPQTGSLVLKLIRRDFIIKNNLQVSEDLLWGEDFCLSLKSLLLSDKTVCVDRPFYHYVQHFDSLTHTLNMEKCISLIQCGRLIENFLKDHGLADHYAFQLNWLKFQLKQYLLIFPYTRDIKKWKIVYPECHQNILQYPTVAYLKVSAWLIVHHLDSLATMVLKLRDLLSSIKNR